ncbi:MAG: methyl-accepting chemotaxis protein [Gammaproteobacteria bacterium]
MRLKFYDELFLGKKLFILAMLFALPSLYLLYEQASVQHYGVAGGIAFCLALGVWLYFHVIDIFVRPFEGAIRILEKVANGQLDNEFTVDTRDEVGWLLHTIKTTQKGLAQLAVEARSVSHAVQKGSQEIAQGNTDLSQRIEEQAASLEETASSMEELTSTVRQNADNAQQANQLAVAAREHAEKGGEVVGKAVAAMSEINTSAKRIADIIGVIDEIAFQTNLLALNAAVEAARAGEQGRGFAVVAGEVRNLAQRSAEAAKEIKVLIQDSVRKVEEGARLVDASGSTLVEIVTWVKKVSAIIADIAAASQEQSAGIEQVNRGITQMDQVTQQNAAFVEEMASASQSMNEQAVHLTQAIQSFRLKDDHAAPVVPVPKERKSFTPVVERRQSRRPWSTEKNEAAQGRTAEKSAVKRVAVGQENAEGGWEEF